MGRTGPRRGRKTADKMEEYRKAVAKGNSAGNNASPGRIDDSPASGGSSTEKTGGRRIISPPKTRTSVSPKTRSGINSATIAREGPVT